MQRAEPLRVGDRVTAEALVAGVLGGMVTATVLAVFATPLFYVLIARGFRSNKADEAKAGSTHADAVATDSVSAG